MTSENRLYVQKNNERSISMKTTNLLLALLLILCTVIILPSCDSEGFSTDPMVEYTPSYEGLSEQETKVRKIADEAVRDEFEARGCYFLKRTVGRCLK